MLASNRNIFSLKANLIGHVFGGRSPSKMVWIDALSIGTVTVQSEVTRRRRPGVTVKNQRNVSCFGKKMSVFSRTGADGIATRIFRPIPVPAPVLVIGENYAAPKLGNGPIWNYHRKPTKNDTRIWRDTHCGIFKAVFA